MTFYSPKNSEELEKIKSIINPKKDIKKMKLNKKIQKQTLNYDLAEQYARITDLQKKTTEDIKKGQQEQKLAIENQTRAIENQTENMRDIMEELPNAQIPAIEDDEPHIIGVDPYISTKLNRFTDNGSYISFEFIQNDLNNYTINDKPFKIENNVLKFDDKVYEVTPNFLTSFKTGNTVSVLNLTMSEKRALPEFVEYAGGFGNNKKSKLYTNIQIINQQHGENRAIEGEGISTVASSNYVFLSSNPDTLVERLEVPVE